MLDKSQPVEKILFRPAEAAIALGVSRSKIYELIAAGMIPSIRLSGSVRIPVAQLRAFIESACAQDGGR
jgi:excisionase family DNA binding protein